MNKKIIIHEIFRGYSSLISTLWSLPAKLTSLLNINALITDQNEYLLLNNGMIIRLETLGALSFDLSAIADISMWSQYANVDIRPK
jgi:hypothetical protein